MPGYAHGAAAAAYRRARRVKNRLLNLVDPPVVILAYHRVAAKPLDPHLVAVSPENFRAQMEHLRAGFRLVRLEEDWPAQKRPAVAVTFDDGYADNLLYALPILEEVGVPATFFLSTFLLDGGDAASEFWWDELERLVLGEGSSAGPFRLEDREHGRLWPATTRRERRELHDALHLLFLRSRPARRQGWLDQLRAWAGPAGGSREADRLLTPDDVRQLASSPRATVGAHTVTHTALTALAEEEQRQEISQSKRRLEALLGRPVTSFAYPFGSRADFDRTSVRLCREEGFLRAVSTLPGQVHRWTDPLQLPRQLVRNWDVRTFASRLEGFWA